MAFFVDDLFCENKKAARFATCRLMFSIGISP